ncbi:MAG: tRNA (N(6)-L-threonylcarbamoyladenosine(37)-C(2))-methylthiotransferase MtaB [Candidatus Acidiferrales bacterium]
MSTFSIENFGCRATDADAAAIRHRLLADGLELIDEHARAEVVVLNTCTVTAAADSQAREAVRKIHRANPAAQIIVTGCYAQRAPEELAAIEGVACVVGNSHQVELPAVVRGLLAPAAGERRPPADFVPLARLDDDAMSLSRGPAKILTGDIFAQTAVQIAPSALIAGDRTRPILKIQDGCNNRCSYCVIPFVRGRSRSLEPGTVVEEVRKLVASGAKEIVLSGINLGAYGRDLAPRVELSSVVRRILRETSLEQLRFSSIEPQDVTEDFVALVASSPRIAPHFHVPLQSGSDHILRAMHRWYRAEHYAERLSVIQRYLPGAAIGADVIVGFPGESDADFQATVEFIERLPFTYLHVFSFSERPGTGAAKLPDRVEHGVIRERARNLRALAAKKSAAFRASQAGCAMRALTLARTGDDWTEALTRNYLKVRVAGRRPANQWCNVRLPLDPAAVARTIELPLLPAPIRTAAQSEDPRAWLAAPESSTQIAPLL